MVFYIICCFGIHVMFLPYMLLFLILSVYKKFLFKPLTTIVLFIILAVVWENSYMKQLSSLVTLLLAQSDHYSAYADNAYEWVTASNRDDVVISITAYLSMLLTNIPVICIGRKYVSQHLQLLPYYNMYILAFALFPAMGKIELFSRYNQVMMIYYCIFAGIIFAFILKQVKLTHIPKYLIVLSILSCLNQIRITTFTYYACSQNKWCTLFIWDAHGRKSIDSELLKD